VTVAARILVHVSLGDLSVVRQPDGLIEVCCRDCDATFVLGDTHEAALELLRFLDAHEHVRREAV
jgi:hypothetical protein